MVLLGKVHCLQQNIMMRKKQYDGVEIKMGKTKSHVYHSTLPASTHTYIYFQQLIN
jgi:hypothetical protein